MQLFCIFQHIQLVEQDYEGMLKEAEAILDNVDDKVFIKVPVEVNILRSINVNFLKI